MRRGRKLKNVGKEPNSSSFSASMRAQLLVVPDSL